MFSISNPFSLKGSEKKIVRIVDQLTIDRSDNLSFIDPAAIKVAAIPLRLKNYKKLDEFILCLAEKIGIAVQNGAQLVCLPELIGLAPLPMVPRYDHILSGYKACASSERGHYTNDILYHYYDFLQEVYFTVFSELACQYGVYLLAGSLYQFCKDDLFNRSYMFDPDGDIVGYQDKTHLNEDEVAIGVKPGQTMELFETRLGRLCVALGQDNCYFEVYRIAKGLGAQMMLCPTCNLNYGIRYPVQADVFLRVQETPLFAVKAALTGDILQRRFGGISGIYCPAALSGEKCGILASGEKDPERPLVARLNLTKLNLLNGPTLAEENSTFSANFEALHYGASAN